MNKRQGKKKYKKTLESMKDCRKTGISVAIITHGFVDKNGKSCNPLQEDARFITFKHPRIEYIKW